VRAARPQYRLRIGEVRVFYDVVMNEVQVLAVVEKSRAAEWLDLFGEANEEDSSV
jgi:mRNA-degrading endonuclease RelE of RelBE toxin-antitoxin system